MWKKLVFVHFNNIRKNKNKRTQKTCAYLRNIFSEIAMIGFQKRGKYIVLTYICALRSLCSFWPLCPPSPQSPFRCWPDVSLPWPNPTNIPPLPFNIYNVCLRQRKRAWTPAPTKNMQVLYIIDKLHFSHFPSDH